MRLPSWLFPRVIAALVLSIVALDALTIAVFNGHATGLGLVLIVLLPLLIFAAGAAFVSVCAARQWFGTTVLNLWLAWLLGSALTPPLVRVMTGLWMQAKGGGNFTLFTLAPVPMFVTAFAVGLPLVLVLTVLVGVPARWLSGRAAA